jgi:hypothetical protein
MGQDGKVGQGEAADMTGPEAPPPRRTFDRLQAEDMANEVRILWSEIAVCAVLALMVAVYLIVE